MNIEEAFREYRDSMVRAMVRFSGDEDGAEDAVSHAFAQAWMHSGMLEAMPEPAGKAWLYAAARNALIDIKRKDSRYSLFTRFVKDDESTEAEIADPGSEDPSRDLAEEAVARTMVERLLDSLPESLRIPVSLKYYEDLNATEIGEQMNLPAATIRTRLRTARLAMYEQYENKQFFGGEEQ
ncbi:MAG: RNA polymerase sigma factor [Treponema sp.]|nr:RNA polymerase sigma factor [Treponema sp.]